MSWNERTTSGTPASFVLLPDRLKRLLRGRPSEDSTQPIVLQQPSGSQPVSQEPIRPQPTAPTLPVMPVDYSPQATVPDPASVRPRTVTTADSALPVLPKSTLAYDAQPGDESGKVTMPDENQLPILPQRNLSQFVLAPDKTQNPDYTPQVVATRPKATDPYGQAVERDLAIRDALANPSQLPKAHGWKRLLPILVRAGQGMAATGNLAGAAGGAIEGGIESAVDPRSATKIQYQRKLGQADENLAGMETIRGRQIKQEGELADIGYKRAQAHRILNPLPQTEVVKVKGRGAYLVNKQTGEERKIDLPDEVNPDEWEQTEADGQLFWRNKRTQETKPMTYNGVQLQNEADRPVSLTPTPGGPTLSVRQGQAASAMIQAQGAQAGEENAQGRVNYENDLGRWREASDAVAAHAAARTALDKSQAQGKALEKTRADVDRRIQQIAFDPKRGADPDDLNKDSEYQGLVRRKEQLDAQYEQVLQENNRLTDAFRSAETALQGRHAPYVRRRDDGSYETAPQPDRPNVVRRGQPRVGQSAAPGGKYTEAEVRKRASAAGKNPEDAVRQARAKNLIQ